MNLIRPSFLVVFQIYVAVCSAQVNEHFADGDLSASPPWTGPVSDWFINTSGQLQSNNTIANSTYYLSTPSSLALETQWTFFVRLNFNTSSANYTDIFLIASAGDLSLAGTTGYFVRIGNTQDEISLFRKDAGTITKLIDGVDGVTNLGDNLLMVKVTRTGNAFTLYRDAGITGSFFKEGTAADATYATSAFFGFLVKQSTAAFFGRHYFDDIVVEPYVPDLTPPFVKTATATSPNNVDILFSEAVDPATSTTLVNYSVNNGIGQPFQSQRDAANNALVHLQFTSSFQNGLVHSIVISNVQDLAGNSINNGTATFSFYVPHAYDVIMDELMADPSPPVSLPVADFIELKNLSGRALNLGGWKIATPSGASGAFPSYELPADSFLMLTSTSNASLFSPYGAVLGVTSFPSLSNKGDTLSLVSREGSIIHALAYTTDWYQSTVKAEGGWTLEMIDPHNPCSGKNNWKAATDMRGGTPGARNSVDGINEDATPPRLIRTYSVDSITIVALFDEPLDSSSASLASNYDVDTHIATTAAARPPLFDQVLVHLSSPMQKGTVYTLTARNIKDCKGNALGAFNKAKTGLQEDAATKDVVVNEILFNPGPGGYDYVELYNKSEKIIDAGKLYLANRNTAGVVGSLQKVSDVPYLIFPGEYIAVTANAASLMQEYMVKDPGAVLQLPAMPSYPDDKGTVVLLNAMGDSIDEVNYSDKWHFALISNPEAISLERIDPLGASWDQHNWHSAASTAGYGTPGYKNSQYQKRDGGNSMISIQPKIFSPDNDGLDDVATINYSIEEPGYVANITIFDSEGRIVRLLVKNALLGLQGSWRWDGLDEQHRQLPIGAYIIKTEIFNLYGKKKQFVHTVVLARRM